MTRARSVAVIGAGMAGLACARALADAGIAVTVFEKSRGTGGRMSTRRRDEAAWDHGAQYFTARDPAFRAEVGEWVRQGHAARWEPRLAVLGSAKQPDTSEQPERFVGAPRMTSPAAHLAQGLTVLTEHTVAQLERDAGAWRIVTAEHGTHGPFDAVALANPAPQARRLLLPVSPALAGSAASVTMQPCWAAMLRYESSISLPFDGAFVNEGPLRWVARNSAKPGRAGAEAWVLHASAEWSVAYLEAAAEEAGALLVEAFRALGAPQPAGWSAHRWRFSLAETPLDVECLWDPGVRVGACGDWVLGGRVEGAWLSGRHLARRIADFRSGEAPPGR